MKQQKNTKLIAIIAVVVIVAVAITAAILLMGKDKSSEVKKGRAFLAEKESENIGLVEESIETCVRQRFRENNSMEKIRNGEVDIWKYFADTVIMGDSRAVGFDAFGYLPSNQVIASPGNTIESISKNIDKAKNQNPSKIILCYGVNDIKLGLWDSPKSYAKDYKKQIEKLKKALPNAKIYVNSILPVESKAYETCSRWKDISEYNNALYKMTQKAKVGYINCDNIVNFDLYEGDYVHLKSSFYPYWGTEIIGQSLE